MTLAKPVTRDNSSRGRLLQTQAMDTPDSRTVLLWEAGPTGQLYALPAGDGLLPGFKLIGVAVLNARQLALAQDVAAALLAESEIDPACAERTWPGSFLD